MSYTRNNYHRRTRRFEPARFLTRAQEERRNALANADYERRRQAEQKRIDDALRAQWDALTPDEQAESTARSARERAASWAEHLYQVECREKRDRDKRDSQSLGT